MSHIDLALKKDLALKERVTAPAHAVRAAAPADCADIAVYHDLAAVEPVWRNLQQHGACTAFQSFEWLSACQRHVGARHGVSPCIVVVRNPAGAPLLILPLAIAARGGFARELTWLGADLCDYNAPLIARAAQLDRAEFAALWRRITAQLQADPRTQYDAVRLEKMPPKVGDLPNPMLALSASLNPSGSYLTPLAPTWDAFYAAKRSSSTRRRDRSKRKHLGEFGNVTFVTAHDATAALETLAVLVEQKSKTFARHGIRNLFARPGYLDFYRDLAANPATRDLVHISQLDVGTQVAATNLGLTFGGCYYHVLASYTDNELSRRGPGAAHLNDLLAYAIGRGLTTFDFTIGDERYKRDWCDGVQPLYDHFAVTGWRGAFAAGPAIALTRAKRAIKQTPLLWAMVVKARAIGALLRGAREPARADADNAK